MENPFKKSEEAKAESQKGYKYLCKANCVFNRKFYRMGDVITLTEKREVPHFKFVE